MKKVMIVGANGQLAFDLLNLLKKNYQVITSTRADLDVTLYKTCWHFVQKHKPNIVINTAAYHNTEECENNPEISFQVNSIGAYNCAKAAYNIGATILFLSSDYVFDGTKKGFNETDKPNPLNIYGASKLAGENLVKIANDKYYIIRTTGLYGEKLSGKGHNFVSLMLEKAKNQEDIEVVNDQYCSPTYSNDLAKKIIELLEKNVPFGIYHLVNEGFISWYEFAKAIFEIAHIKVNLTPISSTKRPSTIKSIKRPKYSVLATKKLKSLSLSNLRPWDQALSEYLSKSNPLLKYLHSTNK